jgi:hypothetical protein
MQKILTWAFAALLIAAPAMAGVFYDDGATTMHFAFEGSPNGDRPIVRAPAFYHADDGFGFVDSPLLTGNAQGVSAPKYFRFDVNLPDGNYDIAVTLGNPDYDSITTIKAECHRAMVLDAAVAAGDSVTKVFTVNVQHGKRGDKEPLNSDGRLNLEFVGVDPSIMKLDIRPNPKAITVYLVGGSSVGDAENGPEAGWGQMLPLFFKPEEIAVSNRAIWIPPTQNSLPDNSPDEIAKTIKPGDWMLLQCGVNEGPAANRVQSFIDVARQHQAKCVLINSLPPGDLARNDIPLIDLNSMTTAFLEKLGSEGRSKAIDTNGRLSAYGAFEMAKLVAQGIKDQKLDLATHLTGNLTTNPDPSKFPVHLGYDYLIEKK